MLNLVLQWGIFDAKQLNELADVAIAVAREIPKIMVFVTMILSAKAYLIVESMRKKQNVNTKRIAKIARHTKPESETDDDDDLDNLSEVSP